MNTTSSNIARTILDRLANDITLARPLTREQFDTFERLYNIALVRDGRRYDFANGLACMNQIVHFVENPLDVVALLRDDAGAYISHEVFDTYDAQFDLTKGQVVTICNTRHNEAFLFVAFDVFTTLLEACIIEFDKSEEAPFGVDYRFRLGARACDIA